MAKIYFLGGSKNGRYEFEDNFPPRVRTPKEWYTKHIIHSVPCYLIESMSPREFFSQAIANYALKPRPTAKRLFIGGDYDGCFGETDSRYQTICLCEDIHIELSRELTLAMAVKRLLEAWI